MEPYAGVHTVGPFENNDLEMFQASEQRESEAPAAEPLTTRGPRRNRLPHQEMRRDLWRAVYNQGGVLESVMGRARRKASSQALLCKLV